MIVFLQLLTGCLVQLVPFAFLCFYPFHSHFRLSLHKTLVITGALLLTLALCFAGAAYMLDQHMPDEPAQMNAINVVFFLCLLPCFGWYCYALKISWQKKLFIFAFTLTAALAITCIQNALWADSPTRSMPYEYPTLLSLAISTAALLPLLMLMLRVCYMPMADGLSSKESGTLALVSLTLFLMLACGIVPMDFIQLHRSSWLCMMFIVLLVSVFVIYVAVFRMLFYAHERIAVQQALSRSERQLEINREQYRHITENIDYAQRQRHELRHHMLAVQGLLHDGKTEEAQNYLAHQIEGLDAHGIPAVCNSPIVNSLIGYYADQAQNDGIVFTAHISMPPRVSICDDDMAVLLGNLLDNALCAAAAAEADQRSLLLNVIYSGSMLAITVDNGYGRLRVDEAHSYQSTKPGHIGIGLKNIEAIAEAYDGGVELTHDQQQFHASVMLNMAP